MAISHRTLKLSLFALAMGLSTAVVSTAGMRSAEAAPLSCEQIRERLAAFNEPIRAKLSEQVAGKSYKSLLKKLTIEGVSSIQAGAGECQIDLVVDAKLDRKIRRDARGSIKLTATASVDMEGNVINVTFSNPQVTDVSMSRTLALGEEAYKRVANLLLRDLHYRLEL